MKTVTITDEERPDGEVGEIWLQGNNIGRGYWGRPDKTRRTFGAKLQSRLIEGSHAHGSPIGGKWLRTGDLGVYLDGELYITGLTADLALTGLRPSPTRHAFGRQCLGAPVGG